MLAFRLDGATLVPCLDVGRCYRLPVGVEPVFDLRAPIDRRERRRWARKGLRGRGGARRIQAPREVFEPPITYRVFEAQRFRNSAGREALVYIPEDAPPTFAQSYVTRMLDRALRAR